MVAAVPEKVIDRIKDQIPLRRLGRPEEIARVVHFLAADASVLHHRPGVGRQRRHGHVEALGRIQPTTPGRVAETYVQVGFVRSARVAQRVQTVSKPCKARPALRNAISSLAAGRAFERSELIAFVF